MKKRNLARAALFVLFEMIVTAISYTNIAVHTAGDAILLSIITQAFVAGILAVAYLVLKLLKIATR